MATATMPGFAAGMTICNSVRIRPAPSTIAASSRPRGIVSKYPTSIQMENGSENVRYVITRPSLLPFNANPVTWLILTKIRYSGSRNRMPGNICVDSTVSRNVSLPRKRYRLIAYAAKMAMATEHTVAASEMTALFTKYLASGIVDQMSTNGRGVSLDGIHWNSPCTSPSGFIAEVTITYSGASVNTARPVSPTTRTTLNVRDSCMAHRPPSARGDQ